MKKFFIAICAALAAVSASDVYAGENVYFYGVDFSEVKVVGAAETEAEFAKAFAGINMLLVSEQEKYDFSRAVGSYVIPYPDMMIEQSRTNDYSGMLVYHYVNPEIDIEGKIQSYRLSQDSGVGMVLIARVLDKPRATATYEAVLFDVATREVLQKVQVSSNARGFGLRNYWAGSVYSLTKRKLFKSR